MVQTSKRPRAGAAACCDRLARLLSPRLFRAFADPKRVSLLVRLAGSRGPQTVSGIADGSGIDLSVVSRHLAVLREAGVIACVKRGKEVRCAIRAGAVAGLLRELADALEACCPEGACLDGDCVAPAEAAAPPRTSSPRRK